MTTPASRPAYRLPRRTSLARFIGIITSPQDTFASVVAHPEVVRDAGAHDGASSRIFTALPLTTEAGRQAALDQQVEQMQSFGFDSERPDVRADGEERADGCRTRRASACSFVSPIFAVIIAGILFAIFNAAMGGEASFKQVFAVLVARRRDLGAVDGVLRASSITSAAAMGSVANLGALLPMLPEDSFAANLLGMVDVFLIWYIVVLAMGLAVLYRRRTQPIAISLLAVYAVIAIVIALVKSRAGGA